MLRAVHWNVRRCVDLTGMDSLDRVLRTVEELSPALLSLNEVDLSRTPSLLEDLSAIGLPHASFFGHVRGTYGNLLASASPLRWSFTPAQRRPAPGAATRRKLTSSQPSSSTASQAKRQGRLSDRLCGRAGPRGAVRSTADA